MDLIQQSSSIQSIPESDKPFSPQSDISHTLWKETMKVSLLFAFERQGYGSVEAAVFTYNLNVFNQLPTSSLMFKCGILDGLRSFQKK